MLTSFFKYKSLIKLVIVLSCLSITLGAQTFYPTDTHYISTLTEEQKQQGQLFAPTAIDSSINNFHNYFPRNTNGNLGLPSSPLLFQYDALPLGFNLYKAPYDNDVIKQKHVSYFKTKSPYASLTGIAGSRREQIFKFLFSYSFKNNLNLTLAFNRYGGAGFYKKQQSFTNNFYTSSHYTSKNNRAGFYAHVLLNKLKHQENGGIKNDSLLLADLSVNKELLPINLTDARREWRQLQANADLWLRLNKQQDSTTKISHSLHYTPSYLGFYTKYIDKELSKDNYYSTFYLDTASTKDSTYWRQIANDVSYRLNYHPLNATFSFGFRNEYNQLHQFAQQVFLNNLLHASFSVTKKQYNGNINAQYIVNGSNSNDYHIELKNKIYFSQKGKYDTKREPFSLSFNIQYENRHPDFIYNKWFGNNYQWTNQFSPTQKLQGLLSFHVPQQQFEIGAIAQQINNALYFNEQAMPMQTTKGITNINLFAKKNTLLFNHLGISTQCNYQYSSYQAITSLPNRTLNGALYYQGNLFKRALQLQIGLQANYYSSFNGMAYMPATNIYYTQTQKLVGDYPFVDFFLNARIKPVRIFIKWEHLNQGLSGSRFDLVPNYWQNNRALKFGINWLFFD